MGRELYETTDYRGFIVDALADGGHTRRDFAKAVGRSDAYVSLVISKSRRLDPELVPLVAQFLRLDDDQAAYLAALVDLDDKSERARRSAWAVVQSRQRHHEVSERLRADIAALYQDWYNLAIFELVGCDGFRSDPAWIARTITPAITAAQATEAVRLLVRLSMLERDAQGELRQTEEEFWSPSKVSQKVLAESAAALHQATLRLAANSLGEFRYNERHVGSFTGAVSEARYQTLLARFAEVELELIHLATGEGEAPGDEEPPNRVVHMSSAMFPMSDFTDTEYDAEE